MEQMNMETIVITIAIALIVALIVELIKYFDKESKVTVPIIDLLTLILGLIGGMIAMMVFEGDFTTFAVIGLTAGVTSSGVYDKVQTLFGSVNSNEQ